jgi:3'-5' exoribonuclease
MIGLRRLGRSLHVTSGMRIHGTRSAREVGPAASGAGLNMAPMTVSAAERTTVAELRAGGELSGVFACTRKDRLLTRSGAPYLAVELGDRTGTLPGRVFRDADFHAASFERGELVEVEGRIERFRDELQAELRSIRRAPPGAGDPADFLPSAYRDLDELDGFLEHLAREVYDRDLRALLDAFLDDDGLRGELRRAPCTRAGHHAYLGGLLEHTVAVATLAAEACTLHPRLNSDLLGCAALLHDIGKLREFSLDGAEIALSAEGELLGHLALGQALLVERAARLPRLPRDKLLAVTHCLLGHHGPDALPGRRFRSPEALALFRLNALDAGVKGALEHGLP